MTDDQGTEDRKPTSPPTDSEQTDSDSEPLGVTVEDIGPARKCLTIEVPADRIAKSLNQSYGRVKEDVQIPGFRKGRAPMQLVERRFGASVREDVRTQLISDSYSSAVEDAKIDVIGEPDVKDIESIKLPDRGSMKFQVEVEVAPEVKLPALKGLKIQKRMFEITDSDVDDHIERLREQFGQVLAVPDAKADKHDLLVCEVRIREGQDAGPDAEEIVHHPTAVVRVPGGKQEHGHVVGIVVDDLAKQLMGKSSGSELSISLTGPAGHEDERIRDKPITLSIRINDVRRLEPASLDELAERTGVASGTELRDPVRRTIESQRANEQRSDMHRQACEHLLEHVQLELPDELTDRQTGRMLLRQRFELASSGVPEPEIEQRVAELRTETQDEAVKQLKQFFILAQAAKQLKVEVEEPEINGHIAMLARNQGRRPEKLRRQMQKNNELDQLYIQIRERKTLDKIIDAADVDEIDASTAEPDQSSETKKD